MAASAAGRATDLRFSFEPAGSKPVLLDPFLAECAVNNILENAFKYSPAGTSVEVRARHTNGHLTVSVRDHGIGIPENLRQTLFQPFHRGANVGRIKGTGVGLFLARRCAELHQGGISLEASGADGSSFLVALPAPFAPTNGNWPKLL